MGISGSASSPAVTSTQFQVAVAKKALDSADQQGQQSLQLIQSAAAPANVPSGVGQRLNVRA
ncbi:MAG TPA: putative motility protein [Polyangiaceae bacterium]|nr:putative motility protein [Polyangiaceae bacterium]